MTPQQEKLAVRSLIIAGEMTTFENGREKKMIPRDYLSEQGSKGGKKRWEGKTEEEKRAHSMKMVEAKKKKKCVSLHCTIGKNGEFNAERMDEKGNFIDK
tara:strand:- start:680 stop:979 length:300 start_codon:yes stop_codon:yes gene_type:complete